MTHRKESVKGYISCVVFHLNNKNRFKGLSVIDDLYETIDKIVETCSLLF